MGLAVAVYGLVAALCGAGVGLFLAVVITLKLVQRRTPKLSKLAAFFIFVVTSLLLTPLGAAAGFGIVVLLAMQAVG